MPDHKSMLCIGGPLAGRRYEVMGGSGFLVPVNPLATVDPHSVDYRPNAPVPSDLTSYRTELFRTPQGNVSFWVPGDQTPLATITLLLETYEQAVQLRAALLAQEKADEANQNRVPYSDWQHLEDEARKLRRAALGLSVEQKSDDRDTIGEDGDQSGTHAGFRHKDNRRKDT